MYFKINFSTELFEPLKTQKLCYSSDAIRHQIQQEFQTLILETSFWSRILNESILFQPQTQLPHLVHSTSLL